MESFIGYLAAGFTTMAFFPQAIKVFKTKHTKDISFWMLLLMNAGLTFWLAYGLLISSLPIIAANSVTIIMAFYILITKIKTDVIRSGKKAKVE